MLALDRVYVFQLPKEIAPAPTNVASTPEPKEAEGAHTYPADAVAFAGNHYKVYRGSLSWQAAEAQCEQMGGHLACADSPEKKAFLATLKGGGVVWVGARRIANGSWQWVNGQPCDARDIVSSEPAAGSRDYAAFTKAAQGNEFIARPSSGHMKALAAKNVGGFICEWGPTESRPPAAEMPEAAAGAGKAHKVPLAIDRLPQGTVELLGITNYPPTNESRWWKPDGSAVNLGPFRAQPTSWSLKPNAQPLAFLVREEHTPAGVEFPVWKTQPSGESGRTAVLDVHGNVVPNLMLYCAELGPSAKTADFSMGIGIGAWVTVVTQPADRGGTSSFSRDGQPGTVTLEKAAPGRHPDITQVRLTTTKGPDDWNDRLVAVTSDGRELRPGYDSTGLDRNAIFDTLPLTSIKEFRYQVRRCRWVVFKNIALQPAEAAASPSARPADKSSPPSRSLSPAAQASPPSVP